MRSTSPTVDRKWGSAYLTRSFFSLLGERLGDRVVLMYAENAGKPVAGALNLAGDEALYGRNWGCRGDWPFLHFELCYYRAIDWAIEHGLKRVEAGAQGRHKIQRGYMPKHTYSAHWIAHTGLRRAVANFLVDETRRDRGGDGGTGRGLAVPQGRGLKADKALSLPRTSPRLAWVNEPIQHRLLMPCPVAGCGNSPRFNALRQRWEISASARQQSCRAKHELGACSTPLLGAVIVEQALSA